MADRDRGGRVMVVTAQPAPPPLPEELTALLRRMRLPYLRAAAPEVLATARTQRWDPAETLRVLLAEEVAGRDDATRRQHRRAAGLPAGKTFASWRETDSSIPTPTQTTNEPREKDEPKCAHYFGYVSSGVKIPEDCLTCSKLLKCLTSKDGIQEEEINEAET